MSNYLICKFPKIAAEWHPDKNGSLSPSNVTYGSKKQVWWLCPKTCPEGCKHEWQSTPNSRTNQNSGCHFCTNRKVCIHTSFVNTHRDSHPHLIKEWHPDKNKGIDPTQLSFGSNQIVWWLCVNTTCPQGCKHEWSARLADRTYQNQNCPFCSNSRICEHESFAIAYPTIATEWHQTKNPDLNPKLISKTSQKKVWWKCGQNHEWEATIANRTYNRSGCPYCKGKACIANNFTITHPEIAIQWHPTKNGDLNPSDFTYGSNEVVWWLCPKTCSEGCKHEWQSSVKSKCKSDGHGCPFFGCALSVKIMCPHVGINTTHPEIAIQWHPTKNGDLNPSDFTYGSNEVVWWLCPKTCSEGCKHEYEMAICSKIGQNQGCPWCVTRKFCSHMSLEYSHPEIAIQWHPTRNGDLKPSDFTRGSDYKAWWTCSKTKTHPHDWKSTICDRTLKESGCPFCSISSCSKIQITWLEFLISTLGLSIQHYKNGGEVAIGKYKVDGFDRLENNIYEFYGCFWHGCPFCFNPEDTNPKTHKKFKDMFEKTKNRASILRKNYNLIEIWECQWRDIVISAELKLQYINDLKEILKGDLIILDKYCFIANKQI